MIYEINSKSDFLSGVSLIVKIPEDELDHKALYTIKADEPEFILPFRHRNIDGQIEFIYQIGTQCKLQHLAGGRSPKDYAQLWSSVLCPLLECGDWFMKPYSFLLNVDYLYCDKNKRTMSYVYIPSVRECSDYDALKEMAAEVTKLISVADTDLENKVLRAIMKDFSPKDFLQMLKSYIETSAPQTVPSHAFPLPVAQADRSVQTTQQAKMDKEEITARSTPNTNNPLSEAGASGVHCATGAQCAPRTQCALGAQGTSGDIVINIPANRAATRKSMGVQKNNEGDNDKKDKDKKLNIVGGLFGKRKEAQKETAPETIASQPVHNMPATLAQQTIAPPAEHNEDTQSFVDLAAGTRFRNAGSALLPPFIDVRIAQGEVFTIGRFDAAIGISQSSFEFDKKTKAVSRRHAAIERGAESYSIIDLSSSAGTYINGQKLPPNTPFELGHGCRVSFGNAGVDYVWEA